MLQYDNGLIMNCISYTILRMSGPGGVFISEFCEIYRHKANSKKPQLSSSEYTCPALFVPANTLFGLPSLTSCLVHCRRSDACLFVPDGIWIAVLHRCQDFFRPISRSEKARVTGALALPPKAHRFHQCPAYAAINSKKQRPVQRVAQQPKGFACGRTMDGIATSASHPF